jgi:amino acid adenylation domain-containing protein
LPELPIQYADYAAWQRDWLQGPTLQDQLDYWKQHLGGELPVLALTRDYPRPPVQTYRGAEIEHALDAEISRQLKELSRREGVTLFMTLLAAFSVLLARYTRQQDILVGTPIAGRNWLETEGLIGFFVNTLVLRLCIRPEEQFGLLLQHVREVVLAALAHQETPFEKLVEELAPPRQLGHTPIFQVMFAFQPTVLADLTLHGLQVEALEVDSGGAKFDLTCYVTEAPAQLHLSFEYNSDLFEAATIERLMQHYERLLEAVVTDTAIPIGRLPLLSASELRELKQWNDTETAYQADKCVHELFEEQVRVRPEAVAVADEREQLTYAELNARANQLAHYLRAQGVGPECLVAVCLDRSVHLLVALLGVLKAGGAYLPLDPSYPEKRLRFMLADSNARFLLTDSCILHLVFKDDQPHHCILLNVASSNSDNCENPKCDATAQNLAYLMYTSGSSGEPKGVLTNHTAIVNRLSWMWEYFPFEADDISAQKTSISFVDSVWEWFGPLLGGNKIVIVPLDVLKSPGLLLDHIVERRITRITLVPSLIKEIIRFRKTHFQGDVPLRLVIASGEQLTVDVVRDWYEVFPTVPLINLYGCTEASADSTFFNTLVNHESFTTPIGRPIWNTEVYLLDGQMELMPVGQVGELYLAGDCLSRGYLGRAALTAEKFVPHPYSTRPGARLYHTGDAARNLADGQIEYLGRLDQQVKLRGCRIELGEIEAALLSHAGVRECVVLARVEANSEQRLVGYVVLHEEAAVTSRQLQAQLREHLRQQLPEHMIPGVFVQLDALPLTANGKLDRRALPAPEAKQKDREAEWPLTATAVEEVLLGLWQEVLRVKAVGLGDNFFELGGHSLLATQLLSRVREAFGVEVALRKLFEEPTVAGLGAHVEQLLKQGAGVAAPPITRVLRAGPLPLSFAQERLWFIDKLESGNPFYNVPVLITMSGELDVDALERTLMEVVRRHEVLRTHFAEVNGDPVQVIEAAVPLHLPVKDLSALPKAERDAEVRRLAQLEAGRAFNLSTGPLLRVQLLRLGKREHMVLLTLHHIITDGWSTGVLIKEVATLYTAFSARQASPLAELEMQYGDYAAWQREWLQGEVLEEQLHYWRRQLGGELPVLELPADRPRPAVQSYRGSQRSFKLGEELTAEVKALSRREGVTLFMTLLAGFQALLYRYTQQDDILIGTAIAGRTHKQTEPLLGCFVNPLVLRTDLSGNPKFSKLLRRVREVSLNAYAHQEVPFEKLVEELQPERSLSHAPLFQVAFGVQNTPQMALELPGLQLSTVVAPLEVGRFELTVWVMETSAGLQVRWSYNTDLFDDSCIERMHRHYEVLLQSIVADPEERLNSLNSLTVAERAQHAAKQDVQQEASLMTLMNAIKKRSAYRKAL